MNISQFKRLATIGMIVVTGFVLWSGSTAMANWADSPLGKSKFNEVWMGRDVTAEEMEGAVVVVEFWGYQCPPCIDSLPHLAALNTRLGPRGLVVIGCHAQGPHRKEAVAIASEAGVNYTIYANGYIPEKMTFRGIPHTFVFDHNGKIIYEGGPMEIEPVVERALANRPHPLLGETKYTQMIPAVRMIQSGRLGPAMKECQKNKDKEGDIGKEATALLANLEKYAKKLQAKAEQDRDLCAVEIKESLETLSKQFAGCEIGTQADQTLKALTADKLFRKNLQAGKEYQIIAGAIGKVPAMPSGDERDLWLRNYRRSVLQIKDRLDSMKKEYPDSKLPAKLESEFNAKFPG